MATRDNSGIAAVIFGQKENFDNLLMVYEGFMECPNMLDLHDRLLKLKPVFTDFGLANGGKVSRDNLNGLVDLVSSVRNDLVTFH